MEGLVFSLLRRLLLQELDLRGDALPPPKPQGQCGSSWARCARRAGGQGNACMQRELEPPITLNLHPLHPPRRSSAALALEYSLLSFNPALQSVPARVAVSRQHAMNCAKPASGAFSSSGCKGGWPSDFGNYAFQWVGFRAEPS
jgi:hypothetical protein